MDNKIEKVIKCLDSHIEYCNATKKFMDAGNFEEAKELIEYLVASRDAWKNVCIITLESLRYYAGGSLPDGFDVDTLLRELK